ncbi:MAG: ribonuclease Y [Thermoguttaceae bacterium]
MDQTTSLYVFVGAFFGALVGIVAVRWLDAIRKRDAATQVAEILRRAELDAETTRRQGELDAKDNAMRLREKVENEVNQKRGEIHAQQRQIDKANDALEKRADDLGKREKLVENTQRKLAERLEDTSRRSEELQKILDKHRHTLHEISGLNKEEATTRLLAILEQQMQQEMGSAIVKYEKQLAEQCETKAREVVLTAIQRFAAAHTAETTTSTIDIPSDEMKGRIIGREGRNIRAFEKATGVDIIIDDTPGVVIVSSFDPVRREVAKRALLRLIADGRIHPARIEELVGETSGEVEQIMQQAGKAAAQEVGVFGLDERSIALLGRLHFRTSYSQNVLRHSIEVAFLSGIIAAEMDLDEKLAKRAGLLHDLGKAVDHEVEGGHPQIGADLLKRYGESAEVIHAAAGHHDMVRVDHPYTMIVSAADACSASRPGARRETLEHYVKRMTDLEAIATEFAGVEQAYAVQAGREMRVLVSAQQVTDESAAKICRDIVKSLTERLQFPGEIKVTVIRESRFTDVAR